MMNAVAKAAKTCEGDGGCLATLNAAVYSGVLNQREDTAIGIIGAFVPWLHVGLEFTRILHGGAGNGGQGVYINGSQNVSLAGFNTNSLKGGGTLNAQFDATNSLSKTQSWENMYNPYTDNSRVTDTK